jgi:RNA polymerase sigma-70 factor (ECF subfamily)
MTSLTSKPIAVRCFPLDVPLQHSGFSNSPADAGTAPPELAVLTRRMAAGDEAAFRAFYEAYYDRLWRYLLVVASGDEDAAREALQSTLLRVVRYVKVFNDEAVFWSWLTVLARTALSDQTRKKRRYLSFLERFTRHAQSEKNLPANPESETTLLVLLNRDLAQLPADDRELLEAKYSSRRSVRELANEYQSTEKAIESRLVRIRRKLKDSVLQALKDE